MGRAVNPLAPAFEGANPSPSTIKKHCLSSFFYLSLIVDYLDFSAISTWLLWVKQFGTAGVVQW
tara:strand:- start:164 stop:355 length:192 start_codon:yes stop_codon:yes gene_type:complete